MDDEKYTSQETNIVIALSQCAFVQVVFSPFWYLQIIGVVVAAVAAAVI